MKKLLLVILPLILTGCHFNEVCVHTHQERRNYGGNPYCLMWTDVGGVMICSFWDYTKDDWRIVNVCDQWKEE